MEAGEELREVAYQRRLERAEMSTLSDSCTFFVSVCECSQWSERSTR